MIQITSRLCCFTIEALCSLYDTYLLYTRITPNWEQVGLKVPQTMYANGYYCVMHINHQLKNHSRVSKPRTLLLLLYYPLANEVAKGYSVRYHPSVLPLYPCEHSRINILPRIMTKHGTYLVLKRIWNPIDFQGQRSRSPGQFLGEEIRHALRCPCDSLRVLVAFILH